MAKKKRIPMGDFRIGKKERQAVEEIIGEVLSSGRITEGPKVRLFEQQWAKAVGTKYCVATSSGTGALITGLTALKYKYNFPQGTKVITAPITYIATSSAISVVGFEPVYVDIDPGTFVITPEAIEAHLQGLSKKELKEYKIILAVDVVGYPVAIDKIKKIAKKYGLLVLEDAAEAEGTVYKGNVAGSQALLSFYSFYVAHNIQAGELGALVTNDEELYSMARRIKSQGRACDCPVCTRPQGYCPREDELDDPRFSHLYIGYNFKPTEFCAALGLVQVKRMNKILERRRENVKYLNKKLSKYTDILKLPPYRRTVSYLTYPLVIRKPDLYPRREVCRNLEALGVETRPLFPCIPTQQPAYTHLKSKYSDRLPNAEYVGKHGFYIGCHQYLTRKDLDYVVEAFNKVL